MNALCIVLSAAARLQRCCNSGHIVLTGRPAVWHIPANRNLYQGSELWYCPLPMAGGEKSFNISLWPRFGLALASGHWHTGTVTVQTCSKGVGF
jgi:hypothetical protein